MRALASLHQFERYAQDGAARAGSLTLPSGRVNTPAFMPVGTQAAVKALDHHDLRSVGAQIVLANTYHLMLRPGADLIERHGGVSRFMRWDGPILTDSGGFQVYSLAANRVLSADGVTFRSHIDGSLHHLSPERAIALQRQFGSDISMALDVCVGYGTSDAEQLRAMDLTHAWLGRNVDAFAEHVPITDGVRPLLFGISQGGFDADRRRESAAILADSSCDGCAIGGLSVGEPKALMAEMLAASVSALPEDRPRYLMGVGSPEDLWNGVAAGIDMFDCVLPTRVARRGALYTKRGRVNVTGSRFLERDDAIDPECDCLTCTTYPIGYVCHLFRSQELLAYRLATIHNLRFIQRQMEVMREAIVNGRFEDARVEFLGDYVPSNQSIAADQRAKFRQRRDGVT
jgi:queuine tRNA-ribosyltransferase